MVDSPFALHFGSAVLPFKIVIVRDMWLTIDWTLRESARAKIRVIVKRILKRHGFPPDLQEEAVKTALAQAGWLSACWADSNTLPHEMDDDL